MSSDSDKLINGGHKNVSPAALLPDGLYQVLNFYLFDKNFHKAINMFFCTKTNIKNENMLTVTSNAIFI